MASTLGQRALTATKKPRASITGYYEVLGSGKVRVSVTSNARKVTLKYHTAKNRHRTVTLTIRKGTATRTLPAGSHALRTQARATSRLRTSRFITLAPKPIPPPAPTRPAPSAPPPPAAPTPPPPDRTPPGPVTLLRTSSVTTTSVTLAWANPPDADLAVIIVDRSGAEVCRALTTVCADVGLNPWTTYSYRVTTQDAAGNLGTAVDLAVRTRAVGAVGHVERVSAAADGAQANGPSGDAAFSPDGTRVAFDSLASNLVPGDTNGSWDVFVKTMATGEIRRVSTTATDEQALGPWPQGDSWMPVWSPDGTRIAFYSDATNLVADDTNAAGDVFVKTLATGEVERVSTDAAGVQGDDLSEAATWSPDGARIAFHSFATNLVPDDTNDAADVFAKTLGTGEIERISVAADGSQWDNPWPGWFEGLNPEWSPTGDAVAFDHSSGVVVKTLSTGEVSELYTGGPQLGGSAWAPDGAQLAVTLGAYTGIDPQVVVVDPVTGGWLELVSASVDGSPANSFGGLDSDCYVWGSPFGRADLGAAWSPDGTHVAFHHCSFDLLEDGVDTNDAADIYVKELTGTGQGAVVRVSTAADGTEADGPSLWASFAPDGRLIAFESAASNLVAGDTNSTYDVFVKALP